MKSAADWFEEGLAAIALSRSADYQSELMDDLRRAVAAFEHALALDPKLPQAQHQRGLALAHLDQHEAALDAFVAAISLAPEDADLRLAVARSLVAAGQTEAALAAFDEVLRLRPGDEVALFGRASALASLGRDALALAAWDEVLGRREPFHGRGRARLARAIALAHLGRAEALGAFRELFDDEPIQLGGSGAPAALRTLEAARAAYRAHVEAHAEDLNGWRRAGQMWGSAGRTVEAIAAWEELLRRAPGDAQAWFGLAEAQVQAGQLEDAVAAYRRSLELWPGFLGASARLRVVLDMKQ